MKEKNKLFSYRAFNQRAGIQSSGFLKLVMDGKRNLGSDGIRKIIKGFQLTEPEAEYFERLVLFNQATTHEEKNKRFRAMLELKSFTKAKPLTAAQYDLFSHWYYVAILELIRLKEPLIKDEAWLEQKLKPKVPLRLVQKAVRELKKLGLLKVEEKAGLGRREQMLRTPDEVQSLGVVNYHQEMSQLAGQVVADKSPGSREFSGLTIALNDQAFKKVKEEIQKFRQKLHALIEGSGDEEKTAVAQINLQLFLLSE